MKNIFVFGADAFNLAEMRALKKAQDYRFYPLYHYNVIKGGPDIPVKSLLENALDHLKKFSGSVDAIVGYWNFPVSTMLPLLRDPFDLPSPSFEAVLKCEHKYWSRLEQRKVVAEHVPEFCIVDPFAENARQQAAVDYPFWIKPVKSASSQLGFKVTNDTEFERAIRIIRKRISRFAVPFNYLLQFAQLPAEIEPVDGYHCIVESIISRGQQCTLEGYVYKGEMCVYGVVDSFREGGHRSCFSRYQYPSALPRRVQQVMIELTGRFIEHTDFDNGPFNIEFFWDSRNNRIWLLEINARISKSHSPLFRHVDGASHHQVMLDLALGQSPDFPRREGKYRCAAKFMWRHYEDALVSSVSSEDELESICRRFPGVEIQLHVHEGLRLSQLINQDSYSYELAVLFIGANSQKELLQKYHAVRQAIRMELVPVLNSITVS